MPAVLIEPNKPDTPRPAPPVGSLPLAPAPDLDTDAPDAAVPLDLSKQFDNLPYMTPIKPARRSRSRVPRNVGVGGIFKTPKPDLPASIFRGDDNPFSPSPDDYDETAEFMMDDNEFDLASELALADQAESANQLLLPPFDESGLGRKAAKGDEYWPTPGGDTMDGLLSPPQIVWKRHFPPGGGTAPGPLARPDTFGSPYFTSTAGSPAPTSTVPSTPTVETSTSAAPPSTTRGMQQAETQASSNVLENPAAAPLLAASIALSVVLGVLLVGLATCGIVKSYRRKRSSTDRGGPEGKDPPSPPRAPPSITRLPHSRSSMSFSASPSYATAASFHTAHSSTEAGRMTPAMSHPQSILITSRSAQSLGSGVGSISAHSHTRRISFVENPMPVNSIEDLHRQLYAPPGWQPGMPLPLAYLQAHGYQLEESNSYEQDLHSLNSAAQMSATWSATPLDTISEEGSHYESDESAAGLAYMQPPDVEQEEDKAVEDEQAEQTHAFVLPTIPSIASEPLEDAMRDGLSELGSQSSAGAEGPVEEVADVDGEDAAMSRRSSATSVRHDADSTFSSAAPGTPRASTSEPSLRSLSFHSACEDVDAEELTYGVIGGYGYAYIAQCSPGGGWEIQTPTPRTPGPQKRVTIATSPTESSLIKGKGKRNRRRRGNKHDKAPCPAAVQYQDGAIGGQDISDAHRPVSRLDYRPATDGFARPPRSFDSVYGFTLPHEESVLGALLMLEENDMDARRAAFSPKSLPPDDGDIGGISSTRKVKRSKSIPTRLFGRSHGSQSSQSISSPGQTGERNTEYFGQFKKALRAMRRDQGGSLHVDEDIVAAPTFRRFSGADWDELDELDPYYSDAVSGENEEDEVDGPGPEAGDDRDERNSRQLAHLSSHFGISEAHFALEDFDFPEPATYLPHIHITSH